MMYILFLCAQMGLFQALRFANEGYTIFISLVKLKGVVDCFQKVYIIVWFFK